MRRFLINLFRKKSDQKLIQPGRMVGNTTRLVDSFIQELFEKGSTPVYDHYKGGIQNDERTLFYFLRRLEIEHNITKKDVIIVSRIFGMELKNGSVHFGFWVTLKKQ